MEVSNRVGGRKNRKFSVPLLVTVGLVYKVSTCR